MKVFDFVIILTTIQYLYKGTESIYGGTWRSLVFIQKNKQYITTYLIMRYIHSISLVSNYRFIVEYYHLSLIAVKDGLRIQR